jgi:hypothetical protein
MGGVDKTFRAKEHDTRDATNVNIAYRSYKTNDGVHLLVMKRAQADYLDSFSPNARLYFLAFTFVDGTDGITNGIARHILS